MRFGTTLLILALAAAAAGCTVVEETSGESRIALEQKDPPDPADVRQWIGEIGEYSGERLLIPLKALIVNLPHTLEAVIQASRDPNPARRSNAAYVLGHSPKSDAAKSALLAMLDDPVLEVRYEVASSLGIFRVKAAIPMLIEGLYDESPVVRLRCSSRLQVYTQQYFNYDPNEAKSKRDFFAGKWTQWWRENSASFEFPRLVREQ